MDSLEHLCVTRIMGRREVPPWDRLCGMHSRDAAGLSILSSGCHRDVSD